MVGGVALGRRCEGRKSSAADVLGIARPQKHDRRQERRRLLGRDGEAVGAQQRDESDEGRGRSRRPIDVAHATDSAIITSRRPET